MVQGTYPLNLVKIEGLVFIYQHFVSILASPNLYHRGTKTKVSVSSWKLCCVLGGGVEQMSTVSNLNPSCIELELELGFDKSEIKATSA